MLFSNCVAILISHPHYHIQPVCAWQAGKNQPTAGRLYIALPEREWQWGWKMGMTLATKFKTELVSAVIWTPLYTIAVFFRSFSFYQDSTLRPETLMSANTAIYLYFSNFYEVCCYWYRLSIREIGNLTNSKKVTISSIQISMTYWVDLWKNFLEIFKNQTSSSLQNLSNF